MFAVELEILKYLQDLRTDTLEGIFEYITMLGEETPMVLIIAILYFAFNKSFAQKLLFITASSLGVNSIIKNLVKLPRPFLTGEVTCVRPDTATGYSFPSGHTQNFATWSTVLTLKLKKLWIAPITVALIILVGFSRVFLGAHYPSDTVVGAILGVLFGIIGYIIYDKVEDKTKLYKTLIFILTPFAILFLINANLLYADFYKFYGMLIGLYLAILVEEKYAPIDYNVPWWKKVIRIINAIAIAILVKDGIKVLNIFSSVQFALIFDALRYLALVFIVFGIWPIIFKKCNL